LSKAFTTGLVGGIIGAITAGTGIVWSIIYYLLIIDKLNYMNYLYIAVILKTPPIQSTQADILLHIITIIFAVLLIVTGVLIGIGYYGYYSAEGQKIGLVALVTGIIGPLAAGILLILGTMVIRTVQLIARSTTDFSFFWLIYFPGLAAWIGLVFLAATFIIFGSTSIITRKSSPKPGIATVAGILSLIGGSLIIFMDEYSYIFLYGNLTIFFGPLGFGLLFISMILWTIMFYSTRK
jgi:hypothetical protein